MTGLVEGRAGARAVDLKGPSVDQGGPKFEIKHKSRCFPKSKLAEWGGPSVLIGGAWPPLAPALEQGLLIQPAPLSPKPSIL